MDITSQNVMSLVEHFEKKAFEAMKLELEIEEGSFEDPGDLLHDLYEKFGSQDKAEFTKAEFEEVAQLFSLRKAQFRKRRRKADFSGRDLLQIAQKLRQYALFLKTHSETT